MNQNQDPSASENSNVILLPGVKPDAMGLWGTSDQKHETVEESDELFAPAPHELEAAVEALLLAADGPISDEQINRWLANPGRNEVKNALIQIANRLRREGRGFRLAHVSKGWHLRTDARYARWVGNMCGVKPAKLSKAALETLAIVAYRQPATRADVEELRGVDPGAILRMLCERGLVRVMGRLNEPGRPLQYGTTPEFLSMFGLRDLSELPTLRDLRELKRDGSPCAEEPIQELLPIALADVPPSPHNA